MNRLQLFVLISDGELNTPKLRGQWVGAKLWRWGAMLTLYPLRIIPASSFVSSKGEKDKLKTGLARDRVEDNGADPIELRSVGYVRDVIDGEAAEGVRVVDSNPAAPGDVTRPWQNHIGVSWKEERNEGNKKEYSIPGRSNVAQN